MPFLQAVLLKLGRCCGAKNVSVSQAAAAAFMAVFLEGESLAFLQAK